MKNIDLKKLDCKIGDQLVDFDEPTEYFYLLSSIREDKERWNALLENVVSCEDSSAGSAILIYLSQQKADTISAEEIEFLITALKSDDDDWQDFSTQAILNLEITDQRILDAMEGLNRYLQEDIKELFEELGSSMKNGKTEH